MQSISHKTLSQLEREQATEEQMHEYKQSEMIYVTNPIYAFANEEEVASFDQNVDEEALQQFREVNKEKELLAENVNELNHQRIRLLKQNEHLDKEIERVQKKIKYFEEIEARKAALSKN